MARKKKGPGDGDSSDGDVGDMPEIKEQEPSEQTEKVVKFPTGGKKGKKDAEENEQIKDDVSRSEVNLLVYRSLLKRKDVVTPCVANMVTLFSRHSDWEGTLSFNEFTEYAEFANPPPWLRLEEGEEWVRKAVVDNDVVEAMMWLQRRDFQTSSKEQVADSLHNVAHLSPHHPVREYLAGIPEWDEEPRLSPQLPTMLGADHTDLVGEFCKRFMISAVARIMEPGCKVDHVPVLVGGQDLYKSTALRTLAGDDFFSDYPITRDINHPDTIINMMGKWIFELEEIDRIIARGASDLKAFISRQEDSLRLPYGKIKVIKKRQGVYVGTTNHLEFLVDNTGNRRYWPIGIERRAKIGAIREERDQLWAEALYLYNDGEPWHITDPRFVAAARDTQTDAEVSNPWEDRVAEYVGGKNFVKSVDEIINSYSYGRDGNRATQHLVADALRKLGWKKTNSRQFRDGANRQTKGWIKIKDDDVLEEVPEHARSGGDGRGI